MPFLLLVLLCLPLPALALPLPESLALGETVTAVEAIDGDTIRLQGGKELRLSGLVAPKDDEPLAEAAKKTLDRLVRGKRLILAAESAKDRFGRRRAQAGLEASGTWLQSEMLIRGLARVASAADDSQGIKTLLALEESARQERQGLWADRRYAVRKADHVPAGRFEIVEGTILASGRGIGRTYLNFGADWKTDFTLTLDGEASKLFREAKLTPAKMVGQKVRVRGFVILTNGPMIELSHPDQVEFLDPPPEKGHKATLSKPLRETRSPDP
ncbi:MAG: thermonuclease family protein [Alphaproteobacteria bacterium]|nr:thermonuclease family protein [Alphaproteobacteria bacterium]